MTEVNAADRSTPVLEVIVCSVTDAIEAERGGAGRLEVVSHLECGGLTPPLALVREILAVVSVPVRVMLRENAGYGVTAASEIERLCAVAAELSALRVDGLVLGFLRDGEIDLDLAKRVLSYAPNLKATFHHAFDEVADPFEAIEKLKKIEQIDRILTGGGKGNWTRRIERLANVERAARPEITLLAGGGLDASVIRWICEATGIREFHVGRAARVPERAEGVVQASRVRELVRVLEECSSHVGHK